MQDHPLSPCTARRPAFWRLLALSSCNSVLRRPSAPAPHLIGLQTSLWLHPGTVCEHRWNDPADNGGSAINGTRIWCQDRTSYLTGTPAATDTGTWTMADVLLTEEEVAALDTCSTDGSDRCRTIVGLKAGTQYPRTG